VLKEGGERLAVAECGSKLGWELRFLVPIPGTPIGSGILILFLIPEILVDFFLKFWCLESQKIGILPAIRLRRNSLLVIVASLNWFQSMYNDLILMVHKLAAPLQQQQI
jgi:hypothetical protein